MAETESVNGILKRREGSAWRSPPWATLRPDRAKLLLPGGECHIALTLPLFTSYAETENEDFQRTNVNRLSPGGRGPSAHYFRSRRPWSLSATTTNLKPEHRRSCGLWLAAQAADDPKIPHAGSGAIPPPTVPSTKPLESVAIRYPSLASSCANAQRRRPCLRFARFRNAARAGGRDGYTDAPERIISVQSTRPRGADTRGSESRPAGVSIHAPGVGATPPFPSTRSPFAVSARPCLFPRPVCRICGSFRGIDFAAFIP